MTTIRKLIFISIIAFVQGHRLRIINGIDSSTSEFPFQVSIQSEGSHSCSGSILNENYVITAAHCVVDEPIDQITVGSKLSEPKSIHKIISTRVHEGYDRKDSVKNDIAILRVTPKFELTGISSSVTLPKFHETIPVSTIVDISGWGKTTYPEYTPETDNLKKTKLTVISNEDCHQYYHQNIKSTIYPGQLCTLETTGERRGPCKYDSGGPLTIGGNKIIGIVSWTQFGYCGNIGVPSVYTRVSEYIDWIEKNTKLDEIIDPK